jgi:heme/copper-type cytochrome/quinol oxidase subunit 2
VDHNGMAAHHMEVNVKKYKNDVHPMQRMRLMMMLMMMMVVVVVMMMMMMKMWNGSEEDGNVRN